MRFARALDNAVHDLIQQGCERLVVDLRGSIGGSLGFARLASYMCPGQVAIGHSLTPGRLRNGYDPPSLPRVPLPRNRVELLVTLARFSFRDTSVMLLTQGLGKQPFHNRIALLVNEWTNSAAEMAANFAAENRLATIVGRKTRGNVLGAMNFKVGGGYWLRLPVIGWFTSRGQTLERAGVDPDIAVDISPHALADWRTRQYGPAYVKGGKLVRYHPNSIAKWIEQQTRHNNAAQNSQRTQALPVQGSRPRVHRGHRLGGYREPVR